jgi:hypothetical protein
MFRGVALLLTVGACGPHLLPVVGPADIARAQGRWPDTGAGELDHGRHLIVGRCGACHIPPTPDDVAAGEWPRTLDEMGPRSHLSPAERRAIERYVITFAVR